MKTYIVLWEKDYQLKLNIFDTRKEAKQYRELLGKDCRAKITKVKFNILFW